MRNLFVGIINGILAIAILFMGLPCFIAGDLNHDNQVDLADAILGVRDLSRSADETTVFGEKIKNAVSAVQIAAGLETQIIPDSDAGFFKSLDNHFLISRGFQTDRTLVSVPLKSTTMSFETFSGSPENPPPRFV